MEDDTNAMLSSFMNSNRPMQFQLQQPQSQPMMQQQQVHLPGQSFPMGLMYPPVGELSGMNQSSLPPLNTQQPSLSMFRQPTSQQSQQPNDMFSTPAPLPSQVPNLGNELLNLMQQPQELLNEIYQAQTQQKEHLEKIRQFQKQFMIHPQRQAFEMLDEQHRQLKHNLQAELAVLKRMQSEIILSPEEIHKLSFLLQELKLQLTQLEIYIEELQQITQLPNPSRCIATLAIVEQPFPMVLTKGKELEDEPVVVQLLSGANVEFQSFSKMKVGMVYETAQAKASREKAIENDTQPMDAFRRIVKWHLRFLSGTRKTPATIRFGIQVQLSPAHGSSGMYTVESHSSDPFIVITNECQWEECEGTLIKKHTFGDQSEISWPYFANTLQRHFLRATRQDIVKPTRPLALPELKYINEKFFGGQMMINQSMFDNFWAWFGKTLQKLRYQRHICPLFQTGLIHGFISREGVDEALRNHSTGTFLLRFSERQPGFLAVAYKVDDSTQDLERAIRHYLIKPEDTAGAKKTLPDFLSEHMSFVYLLQVTYDSNGTPIFKKFSKDYVLEPYYSKRNVLPSVSGYDDRVENFMSPGSLMEAE